MNTLQAQPSWLTKVSGVLERFPTISLEDAQQVQLANRQDTKYLFGASQLLPILHEVQQCRVLDINGARQSRYETLYFDTPDWLLLRQHARGQLSRYKIRTRRYVETDTSFLELKVKNNKYRTVKSRMELPFLEEHLSEQGRAFLGEHLPALPQDLRAVCRIKYRRLTLINEDLSERMTVDFDLSFDDGHQRYHYPNLVIAEVKQERSSQSAFTRLMRQHAIRKGKLSKYCWSVLTLHPELRRGLLNPMIQQLNKVLLHHA